MAEEVGGVVAVSLGVLIFWSVIAASLPAMLVFRPRVWGGGFLFNLRRMVIGYRWHLGLLAFILVEKNFVDDLNDPLRGVFGDFTWLIHTIEGDATYALQQAAHNPWLTAFLNVHYLWVYVFLNYFSVLLFAYRDDRELANMASLNYSIIYLLAVPFYIFFNVQVTSDFIPGMESLLYHAGASWMNFFVAADPLDNAFPSLHIAIPWGLILCMWWEMRRRGYTLRDWEYRNYFLFLIANFLVFVFSILYLGIHWITDIPGGLLVGLLGAVIADEYKIDLFAWFRSLERRIVEAFTPWVAPVVRLVRRR